MVIYLKHQNLIEKFKADKGIADKTYYRNAFIEHISEQKSTPVILSKRNRKILRYYDTPMYKKRHLIEYFLNRN
ncbi:hypothetical protein P618_200921 [Holospora obtusa F1]|uniref:Uncharacterized protein n=1 Tax=Holospora obtusa F1 TaxID=1399147 RepID=W6TDQ0_HOLOB|nr:hypothetical protein P618_200921 [Holospora obtusa F1]